MTACPATFVDKRLTSRRALGSRAMAVTEPDGIIDCDKCGASSETSDEQAVEAGGWLIDRSVTPHKHFCPECKERAL